MYQPVLVVLGLCQVLGAAAYSPGAPVHRGHWNTFNQPPGSAIQHQRLLDPYGPIETLEDALLYLLTVQHDFNDELPEGLENPEYMFSLISLDTQKYYWDRHSTPDQPGSQSRVESALLNNKVKRGGSRLAPLLPIDYVAKVAPNWAHWYEFMNDQDFENRHMDYEPIWAEYDQGPKPVMAQVSLIRKYNLPVLRSKFIELGVEAMRFLAREHQSANYLQGRRPNAGPTPGPFTGMYRALEDMNR